MAFDLLLVDDDEDMNFLHQRLLNKSEKINSVIIRTNGKDAIDYLEAHKEHPPDLIFIDLNMPVMDGWETVDYIKENYSTVLSNSRIYILSSSINPKDFKRAENHPNIEGMLEKFLSHEKLENILK